MLDEYLDIIREELFWLHCYIWLLHMVLLIVYITLAESQK